MLLDKRSNDGCGWKCAANVLSEYNRLVKAVTLPYRAITMELK